MIPPCWLFGLKYSSTGVYRLLGEARSPYKNGHPWSTHQGIFLRASIIKVLALPVGPHLILGSPRDSVRLAGRSMGSYGVTALPWVPVHVKPRVHPPRVESLVPPQSCGAPTVKPDWFSKPNALEALSPDSRPPGWGA